MAKIGLIIIFNHRYEKNIPKLKKIYEGRFSHIYFAVPFYKGGWETENIIPVYESGKYFETMIPYIWNAVKNEGFDYLFFLPEDMVINPKVTEDNCIEYFRVNPDTAYINKYQSMQDMALEWPFWQYSDAKYCFERHTAVNYKNEILSAEEAFQLADARGWQELRSPIKYPFFKNGWKADNFRSFFKYPKWALAALRGKFTFAYPLMQGFSDIFIIPKVYMNDFANYCGVFGAMNLHLEVAIPTAIMLACGHVVHQYGKVVEHGDPNKICEQYNGKYTKLIDEWDDEYMYVHPIKLSTWEV